ncbi:MAG: hypothetical protein H6727_04025 [Myxococcales bacterium]|nr:hypothetical protein [Myxococcales bacterium]
MRLFAYLLGLSALLTITACKDSASIPENQVTPTYTRDHWTTLAPSQTTQGHVSPHAGRQARRLSLKQIRAMVPRLFDGMNWLHSDGKTLMFDRLSSTLGEADYIFQTETTRDATPLFMKFMDDMASQMCNKAVDRDMKGENANKLIVLDERDIDKTLRFLRLKFHTIHVPEGSTKGIDSLRQLYDKTLLETSDRKKSWFAVCFQVMTAPEFFAY